MIDLDNLGNTPNKPQTNISNAGGELGLVFVGSQKSEPAKPAVSVSLPELYSAKKKLIYLIDRSGSMNSQVAGVDQVKYFNWSSDVMDHIRASIEGAVKSVNAWADAEEKFERTGDDTVFDDLTAPDSDEVKLAELAELDGLELKKKILQLGLNKALGIVYTYDALMNRHKLDSRLGLVQEMAERMITERKSQFPDSDTQVIAFDDKAELLPARTTQELIRAVQGLQVGGSTSILRAIKLAMSTCNRKPSEVKLHHFVLVTDGEDYDTVRITEFIPAMLEMGVVLDWIFIANPGDDASRDVATAAIKAAVDATGGTFTVVTTAPEFETKFVEASKRKLLPPAK